MFDSCFIIDLICCDCFFFLSRFEKMHSSSIPRDTKYFRRLIFFFGKLLLQPFSRTHNSNGISCEVFSTLVFEIFPPGFVVVVFIRICSLSVSPCRSASIRMSIINEITAGIDSILAYSKNMRLMDVHMEFL